MRARMRADRPRVYVVLALALACAWYAPDANALTVRDQAAGAGLAQTTSSYGAYFGDVNGDGRIDILLNRHWQRTSQIFTDRGGGVFGVAATLPLADRHGCAMADVNHDGLIRKHNIEVRPIPIFPVYAGLDMNLSTHFSE